MILSPKPAYDPNWVEARGSLRGVLPAWRPGGFSCRLDAVRDALKRLPPSCGSDAGYGIATDPTGNVCVAGFSSNGTNDDYLTTRYRPDGSVVWERKYDGGGEDWALGVAVGSQGGVCVTGTSCTARDQDWVTIKYDAKGNELWQRRYDRKGNDWASGVAVDTQGSVYVGGVSHNGSNQDYAVGKLRRQ